MTKRGHCDFTDSGECAAKIPIACICSTPAYRRAEQRRGEKAPNNLRIEAAAEIERLRQQLWLVREDMAHLVQQIDTVLGPR